MAFDSHSSYEMHQRAFTLTLALYRVTDFFPHDEVLKRQLREKANEIFGNITEYCAREGSPRELLEIAARIQSIKGYLAIGRSMRFVKPINLAVLDREYDMLAGIIDEAQRMPVEKQESDLRQEKLTEWHEFSEISIAKKEPVSEMRASNTGTGSDSWGVPVEQKNSRVQHNGFVNTNERQKAILEYLHKTESSYAKIGDLHEFFTNISAKTIQRDLQDLVNKNILRREGEKRWTKYSLIK